LIILAFEEAKSVQYLLDRIVALCNFPKFTHQTLPLQLVSLQQKWTQIRYNAISLDHHMFRFTTKRRSTQR